eukprot:scpid108517/ scgid15897/ 
MEESSEEQDVPEVKEKEDPYLGEFCKRAELPKKLLLEHVANLWVQKPKRDPSSAIDRDSVHCVNGLLLELMSLQQTEKISDEILHSLLLRIFPQEGHTVSPKALRGRLQRLKDSRVKQQKSKKRSPDAFLDLLSTPFSLKSGSTSA